MTLSSALKLISGRSFRRFASAQLFSLIFLVLMGNAPLFAQAPLLIFKPSTPTLLSSTYIVSPFGVAYDSSGDLFVIDLTATCNSSGTGALIEYEASSPTTPHALDCNLGEPFGVTVDSSGNIYVADSQHYQGIYKYTYVSAGTYTRSTVTSGTSGFPAADLGHFDAPSGVAVDPSGNVYVADSGDSSGAGIPIAYGGLYVTPYNGGSYGTTYAIGGSTFVNGGVYGVSIDSSGNLYATVSTSVDNLYGGTNVTALYKLTGSGTTWTPHLIDDTYYLATAIAIDPAGNLYVSDDEGDGVAVSTPGAVYKETFVSGNTYTKSSYVAGLYYPEDVVIDKNANLYIPDSAAGGGYNPGLYKVSLTTPPTLNNFGSVAIGSDSTAQSVTVTNIGNAALDFSDVVWPADFSASGSNTCTSSTVVGVNGTCDLSIQFSPQNDGTLDEDVTLTDNTLGVTGTEQMIAVDGTGTGSAVATHFTVSGPGTATPGTSFSVTVTAETASDTTATGYTGTVHFTSSDGSAVLPANYTFTSGNAGTHTFSVTLNTGGSQTVTATDTATGSISGSATVIVQTPTLAIVKSHTGTFTQGQTATWTLQVSNAGSASTTGATVTVTDTLASGYTLASFTGSNWSCSGSSTVTCTSTAVIAGSGGSFPLISLAVNVPANSATSVSNTANVFGGGDLVHSSSGTAATSNTNTVTVVQVAASITANSGSTPQSAQVTTSFANPLAVTVKDAGGVVISGASVTFTAPGSGASGTFSNSIDTITTTTNSSGVVSEVFTANGNTGSYSVSASVTGVGSPATFSLTNNKVSSITSANNTTFTVGSAGTFTVSTTGYPAPTLSDGGATLPTGVNFVDNGNGTATLSGTPAGGTGGSYAFTVTASNGVGANATQSFTLTVDQAPAITSGNSTSFIQGVPGTFTVTSTGYPTASLSESGVLPTGVTFVDNGDGTGTLAGKAGSTGSFPISIIAGNGVGTNFTQSFTLTVNPVPNYVVTTASDGISGVAAHCPVSNSPPSSNCTLRDAIEAANVAGAGNITFSSTEFSSAQTISIVTGGTLVVPAYTTITGATSGSGATLTNLVTVSGGGSNEVFAVFVGIDGIFFNNLNIVDGAVNNGAGIENLGILTLNSCTISGNTATTDGGGILNGGILVVNNSTIVNNGATSGGAIYNTATMTVNNSTIANNTASSPGGGLYNHSALTLNDSTISGNSAGTNGGGVFNDGTFSVANSIVSGNSSPSHADIYNGGAEISSDGNELGISGINLAPLGWYGGPTQTMIPLPGSPAICEGTSAIFTAAGLTADQRGDAVSTNCPSGYVDSGAVQSNYAVSFSTEPQANVTAKIAFTSGNAPQVTVSENGATATWVGGTMSVSDTLSDLSGSSITVSSGVGSFSGLKINISTTSTDKLTATLSLNSALPLSLSTTSNTFTVDALTLSPTSLSNATVGVAYSQTFTASNGTSPYTYTLTSGSFPTGLTMTSGVLSGTPTAGGTFSFTIKAADSASGTISQNYTLIVNAATIVVSPSSLPNGTYGTVYSQSVSAAGGTATYSYTIFSGTQPTGLLLNASTGVLSGTPTAAGVYNFTVQATDSSTGTGPYTGSRAYSVTIAQATATINVTPYSVTYNASSHTATATATGVGGVNLIADMNLTGTTHTNAGTYASDAWSFTDPNGNYKSASGTVSDTISQATATITVTPYSVTYNATSHTATGTATGVGSANLNADLNLTGTTHTNAGTYASDAWSFTDPNGNYKSASGTVSDTISQATATITVTPYSVTYDGNAHTASGSATGVGSANLNADLNLTGTTHTNAGTYASDAWSFTDPNGNYKSASGTVSDTISQATATITITPYNVQYDGNAHTATGTATGVGSANLNADLNLTGTTHTIAGTYTTDAWSFTDPNSNYKSASGTVTDVISKATQTVTFIYSTTTYTYLTTGQFTVDATASSGLPVTFTTSTPSVCIVSGTSVEILTAGTCSIVATQSGNANYQSATATLNNTINKATQSITYVANHASVSYSAGLEFNLDAKASSSLPVSYIAETPTRCSITTNTRGQPVVLILTAGVCEVEATQTGNVDYQAATPVINTYTILQ